MSDTYLITAVGYHKLLRHHERLQKELEDTQRQMGREASIDNDLRENPAFMELRRRAQYTLPGQIAETTRVLRACKVFGHDLLAGVDTSQVGFGTRVVLRGEDGLMTTYVIVGYGESEPEAGRISYLSPLGSKLLGQPVGATLTIGSRQREREVTIVAIDRLIDGDLAPASHAEKPDKSG